MSDGTHSQLQKILKILSLFVRAVLLLLALAVACNFFSSIIKVYTMKWYLHCEHEALGLFFGSFFWLQLMFLLRFTGIRHILLFVGGCGLAILTLKLQTPPDTSAVPAPGSFENWPSPEDVKYLCFFCAFLFVEGLVFPYVVNFTNLTVVRPLQYIFSLLKKI